MNAENPLAAVSVHSTEALLFFTLLQLAVIVVAGRVGGALAPRWGQAPVVGHIVAGILLGPSLFGLVAPGAFDFVFRSAPPEPMQILSGLALVLVMFQVGLEFDFSHLTHRVNRAAVMKLAGVCLVLPFSLGLGFGYATAPVLGPHTERLIFALFIATAFSITALPVLGRIILELHMERTRLGVVAISAAAVNDVVGWLLLALTTALAQTTFDPGSFSLRVALVAAFIVLGLRAIRPLLKRVVAFSAPHDGRMSNNLLGGLLAVVFIAAMTTYQMGIFALFGAFMIGVILYDEPELVRAWRERMGNFVTVFFLPIFFTYTGLRTSIGGLDSLEAWGWCALILVIATAGKFGGAYLAARASRFQHAESMMLGYLMNTRGLMEFVVINVGYDLGVISQQMFTILVIMAIVSTVITTPMLRRYLPRAEVSVARPI